MANFPDTQEGFAAAEAWAVSKTKDHTFVNAHAARDKDGHVIVRFQRYMSPAAPGEGAWITSRDDAAT
jgi:hypothetical protein